MAHTWPTIIVDAFSLSLSYVMTLVVEIQGVHMSAAYSSALLSSSYVDGAEICGLPARSSTSEFAQEV